MTLSFVYKSTGELLMMNMQPIKYETLSSISTSWSSLFYTKNITASLTEESYIKNRKNI